MDFLVAPTNDALLTHICKKKSLKAILCQWNPQAQQSKSNFFLYMGSKKASLVSDTRKSIFNMPSNLYAHCIDLCVNISVL